MSCLLIFDFDGVIVDSELIIRKVLNEYIEKLGVKVKNRDEFIGIGGSMLIKKIEDMSGVTITELMIHKYYKGLFETLSREIKPLLFDTINKLKQQGFKYCIATNSIREQVDFCLKMVNMNHYFSDDNIFTIEQVRNGKPAPDLFLLAADSFQVNTKQCLVIEDSPSGVLAARAADMDVVAFMGGGHAKSGEYINKIMEHQAMLLPDESALLNHLSVKYHLKLK